MLGCVCCIKVLRSTLTSATTDGLRRRHLKQTEHAPSTLSTAVKFACIFVRPISAMQLSVCSTVMLCSRFVVRTVLLLTVCLAARRSVTAGCCATRAKFQVTHSCELLCRSGCRQLAATRLLASYFRWSRSTQSASRMRRKLPCPRSSARQRLRMSFQNPSPSRHHRLDEISHSSSHTTFDAHLLMSTKQDSIAQISQSKCARNQLSS